MGRKASLHPACPELDLESPGAIGFEAFTAPEEGIVRDFAETPPNRCPVWKFPFLHDVVALAASNQFGTDRVVRVEPVCSPCLNGGIVNTNGRAIPIRKFRRAWPAV